MDRESLYSLHPLELGEPVQGNLGCAGCKRQNLGSLVAIEGLEGTPPPDNVGVRAGVADVLSSSAPFIHVNVGSSGDEQLQFLFVELRDRSVRNRTRGRNKCTNDGNKFFGNDLVEPGEQALDLVLD